MWQKEAGWTGTANAYSQKSCKAGDVIIQSIVKMGTKCSPSIHALADMADPPLRGSLFIPLPVESGWVI